MTSLWEHVFRGLEEEPGEATFFLLHPTQNHYESMFLGASQVKLFYFTPFGRKRLQTASEAGGEALPNGALLKLVFKKNLLKFNKIYKNILIFIMYNKYH